MQAMGRGKGLGETTNVRKRHRRWNECLEQKLFQDILNFRSGEVGTFTIRYWIKGRVIMKNEGKVNGLERLKKQRKVLEFND